MADVLSTSHSFEGGGTFQLFGRIPLWIRVELGATPVLAAPLLVAARRHLSTRRAGRGRSATAISFVCLAIVPLVGAMQVLTIGLQALQRGVTVAQTGGDDTFWFSAVDALGPGSVTFAHLAQMVVLALILWILLRVRSVGAAKTG